MLLEKEIFEFSTEQRVKVLYDIKVCFGGDAFTGEVGNER